MYRPNIACPLRAIVQLEPCSMLNVFTLVNGRLVQEEIESAQALAAVRPVWGDLESPSSDEKAWVEACLGIAIPEDIVDDDLEESARFYEEDNGELHIRSDFLIDDDVAPRNVCAAFILHQQVLFAVHPEDLPVFRLLRLRAAAHSGADRRRQGRAAQALRR